MLASLIAATGASGDNGLFISLILGFVPAAVWLAFFYTRDRFDPEPKSLILRLFLTGAIPVFVAALIINSVMVGIVGGLAVAFLVAPIVEESLKFLGYSLTTRKSPALNELVDGMIYGSAIGFGFSAAENVLYFTSAYTGHLPTGAALACHTGNQCVFMIAPTRILFTSLMHGMATGIGGYFFAKQVLEHRPRSYAYRGVLAAAGLHILWNTVGALFLPVIAVPVWLYFHLLHKALAASPFRTPQLVKSGSPAEVVGAHVVRATSTPAAPAGVAPPPPPDLTHAVPVGGIQAWLEPDPSSKVIANLAAGLHLRILEQRGDWAHVAASNGWSGWVDARRLIAVTGTRT